MESKSFVGEENYFFQKSNKIRHTISKLFIINQTIILNEIESKRLSIVNKKNKSG